MYHGDIIITCPTRPRPRPLDLDERRAVSAALAAIVAALAAADMHAYWDAHDRYNRLTTSIAALAHEVRADVERGRCSVEDAVARLTEATRRPA